MKKYFVQYVKLFLCVMLVIVSSVTFRARSASIAISLAVPDNLTALFSPQIIAQFEAAHPDTHVDVIPLKVAFPKSPTDSGKYLQAVRDLASTADVVLVTSDHFNPKATRAHAVVDLKQYTDFDKSLNADDFYPALWQSFQWDNAIWALPLSGQFGVLSYDPAAFDQAGVAYPSDNWTLDQLADAVRKLGQKDSSGHMQPALDTTTPYFQAALFRSLLTSGLFDPNSVPNPPQFDRPDVEALATTWAGLSADGLVSVGTNDAPLGVIDPYALTNEANKNLKAALLPGGHAALVATGLAVSIGTQYPDQAYALASFLAQASGLARPNLDAPARKSLDTASHGDEAIRAIVDKALAHALSGSEVRYADYLPSAVDRMVTDHVDAKSALQATELAAVNALQTAADPKSMMAVSVPTIAPDTQATLKISIAADTIDHDLLNKLAAEFVSHDPEIKRVIVPFRQYGTAPDCYIGGASYDGQVPTQTFADLTPYIIADGTLDKSDFVGDTLKQVTIDNMVWAYPLTVDLSLIKYDPILFKQAGVPLPTNNWTVNTLLETLKGLQTALPNITPLEPSDQLPRSWSYDSPYIGLMAAFGGVPFDYSTNPISIVQSNLVLSAEQQTLDLVKSGAIKYHQLVKDLSELYSNGSDHPPMVSVQLTPFTQHRILSVAGTNNSYQYVLYPNAIDHKVVVYGLGAGRIDKDSAHPEACYRWFRFMASHPELFQSMPASRSQLNNSTLAAVQGSQLITLYHYVDNLLATQGVVSIPAYNNRMADWIINFWLSEAFDKYLIDGGDLKGAISDAALMAQTFLTRCDNQTKLNPALPSYQRLSDYEQALGACAQQIDPVLKKFIF